MLPGAQWVQTADSADKKIPPHCGRDTMARREKGELVITIFLRVPFQGFIFQKNGIYVRTDTSLWCHLISSAYITAEQEWRTQLKTNLACVLSLLNICDPNTSSFKLLQYLTLKWLQFKAEIQNIDVTLTT